MVPVEIRCKADTVNHGINLFIERRVSFALDRFRNPRRVVVSLEDVNGPKGGPGKLCRIIAEFEFASLVVQEVQSEWHVAIARAIDRVAEKLSCKLARRKRPSAHLAHRTIRKPFRRRNDSPEAL